MQAFRLTGFALVFVWMATSAEVTPRKVDFRRDIQPLFQEHCIGCHGPSQQMGDMRLDRRSSAMAIRGGTRIGPGNAAGSRLYNKLIGTKYGNRMPPTGPLTPQQIELVKNWIDQGAEWPDDLSGDRPAVPPDPKAVQYLDALRGGDRKAFERLVHDDKKSVNARGLGGATPLMYAALYGDPDSLRKLLDAGADPNLVNQAGATALIWALDYAAKTQLLLEHGANPNVNGEGGRSLLTIALSIGAPPSVLRLLFEHGVKLDLKTSSGNVFRSAGGNEAVLRLLMERGIDSKTLAGGLPVAFADGCKPCVDLLIRPAPKSALTSSLLTAAGRDPEAVRRLLGAGADAKFSSSGLGFTALMYAAGSETGSAESAKMLVEHGADVNAKTADGATALDFASGQGRREIIDLLKTAGAKEGSIARPAVPKPKPAESASVAVRRAIPLLQHSDVEFLRKAGCVSCHSNNLTAMTIRVARQFDAPFDDGIAKSQLRTIAAYIEENRERYLQGLPIAGGADTAGYILLGLAAEKYPPSPATDAMARFLKQVQRADGSWRSFASRPPLESSGIQATATNLRALQVYGIGALRANYEKSVQLAAEWLEKTQPKTNEDRVFQLLGLAWAGAKPEVIRKSAEALLAEQRPDGGWAQLPTLASDAYATGEALVALKESDAINTSHAAYLRGAHFLLNTQLEDGSWYVRSRSIPFQPYFESGFPHGVDQFLSNAATNWATMALIPLASGPGQRLI